MGTNAQSPRYDRQVLLPELGIQGQEKLLAAKVLVVGAGGLGCPVLQYLAAAGVGTIGVVDDDVVSLSNPHRQILFGTADVGSAKTSQAVTRLQQLNPESKIVPYQVRLTNENAFDIIQEFAIIVDATDNFPARYLINDACFLLNKPLVYGAVSKFEGQVAVFNVKSSSGIRAVNYRDLFPQPPKQHEIPNCSQAGVIGVLPGIIGCLQAGEVIKIITGIGTPLVNKLQVYNFLANDWFTWDIFINPVAEALLPRSKHEFINSTYDFDCSVQDVNLISPAEFDLLKLQEEITVIDVRDREEKPMIDEFKHERIPLRELESSLSSVYGDVIVVICQSGKRSKIAADVLMNIFPTKKIYSLNGGITAWREQLK